MQVNRFFLIISDRDLRLIIRAVERQPFVKILLHSLHAVVTKTTGKHSMGKCITSGKLAKFAQGIARWAVLSTAWTEGLYGEQAIVPVTMEDPGPQSNGVFRRPTD